MFANVKHNVLTFMGMALVFSLWGAVPEAVFWDHNYMDLHQDGKFWYLIADDGTAVITAIDSMWGYDDHDDDGPKSVTIPAKLGGYEVSRIGYFHFDDEKDPTLPDFYQPLPVTLENISVEAGSKYFAVDKNVLYSADRTVLYLFPSQRKDTSFTVPSSVKIVYHKAFRKNKDYIQSVTLPNGLTEIGYSAFEDCNSLTSINLPNSLTRIWDFAFEETKLSAVTIPANLTQIGCGILNQCGHLNAIKVDAKNKHFISQDGVLFNYDKTKLIQYPKGKAGDAGSPYSIPNGVKIIGNSAFNSAHITQLTIPNTVTTIEPCAFVNIRVTAVTIPASVTSIGNGAFEECKKLKSVTIPASVTSIGARTFKECKELESVTIPASVTSIGYSAFRECAKLKSVTIPASVTSIGSRAFEDCEMLTKENVTFLGDLPEGVEDAFDFGYELLPGLDDYDWEEYVPYWSDVIQITITGYHGTGGNITIPKAENLNQPNNYQKVTKIAERAFSGNETLTSVTLPVYLNEIGDFAFAGCTNIRSFAVAQDNGIFQAVDGVLYCGDTLVAYPAGKTAREFTVPDWVTGIAAGAFSGCTNLETVYIGTEYIYMSEDAFDQDEDLTIISDNGYIVQWRGYFPSMTIKGLPHKLTVDGVEYTYNNQDRVEIPATAPDGFAFQRWVATGVYLSSPTSRTVSFDMPANDVTLVSSWSYSQALQAGWNVITPALNLDAVSCSRLESLKAYGLGSVNAYARGGEFPAGKSLWVYSQSARNISLSGLAPVGWSFAPAVGWNFLGSVRRVAENDWRGNGTDVWEWQGGEFRRKLNGPLDAGDGYWIYQGK
jgi:hypothetical protein